MFLKGCFASVIAFAPQHDTCKSCALFKECAEHVFSEEKKVITRVEKFDAKRLAENPRAPTVARFFKRRQKVFRNPLPSKDSPHGEHSHCLHAGDKTPEAAPGADPYRVAEEFLSEVKVASLKDFREHFTEIKNPHPKADQNRAVRKLIKDKMDAGELKKEGSLFCLQ